SERLNVTKLVGNYMLSIIIPTFNEEKFLPRLFKSLQEQTLTNFEVIVADHHSTDATREIALRAGAKIVTGGRPAAGRNRGAQLAQGDWLLFLDADVVLPPDFLEKALKEIEKQNLVAASCLVEPLSQKKIDKFLHDVANFYLRLMKKISPRAPGACIFIKKEIHQTIGGFDENLQLAEDHDYVKRASELGKFGLLRCVYLPISVRRLEKEGRLHLSFKYLAVETHLVLLGPIYSDIFNYKFGHFN
ncbi:MAG: glycosyltransferase, partial [Minisyncoccales bacterium]